MNEIIININEANKAQRYQNKNELFQIEAFEKVSKILQEHTIDDDKTKDITDCRFHDTIFIDGDRGVGKTAFMINIEEYYNKFFIVKQNTKKEKYIFLKPVDPTLLEHTEKFLSVVLAKILDDVNNNFKNITIEENNKNEYFEILEKLSKSLEAIKTLKDDIGIEEIASNKSSLKLEQHAHEFFKIVCKIFDVNAIVLLIDDVDMAFDKGFDVLEVVRKYLASPYLIPIVAGDIKLYREIIETKFKEKTEFFNNVKYLKDLNPLLNNSEEYKEKIKLLNNLVEQYLHKIFPQEYRIGLKDIFLVIRENKVTVRFENLDVPLTEIKDFEIRHINFGINQLEFIFKVFRNNTRKLIQYLTSKKEIYIDFFTQIDFPKDTKYQPYLPQNVIAKYDKSIISFMSSSNYKKSLEITYLNLKDEKKDDEESGLIKYLKNDLSSQFLINQEFQKLFQTKEIENGRYTIHYKNIDEVIKIQSKYYELENYIINLFIHNDYMTQHQTKNYIFSGKFVELIIFSLFIQDKLELDENLFQNIRKKIKEINFDGIIKGENYPIYSIIFDTDSKDVEETDFKKDSNYFNELQIYKDFLELSLIANSTPFNSNRISEKVEGEKEDEIFIEYKTESLSRTLILWKNIFANNINLNSTALYRILEKFFANLSDMKSQKLDDNPLEFLQRIVLIFINSVAYFENTNIRIANTNIAIGSKFDISIALTKTNAATLNIKPLVNEENTLTKALFFHPIISHILFPNKDSKLYSLRLAHNKEPNKMQKESKSVDEILESYYDYNLKALQIGHKINLLQHLLDDIQDIQILKDIAKVEKFSNRFLSEHLRTATDEELKLFNSLRQVFNNKIK